MRRFMGLFCGMALLAPGLALGQAAPAAPTSPAPPAAAAGAAAPLPQVDLSHLNLRMAEARVVDSIEIDKTPVKAQAGSKLVVITLRGTLKLAGRITVAASAFSTLYSETSGAATVQEKVGRSNAQAVDLGGEGTWATRTTTAYPAPKPVLLEVAVPVPLGVKEFYILYDTDKGKRRAKVTLEKVTPRTPHM